MPGRPILLSLLALAAALAGVLVLRGAGQEAEPPAADGLESTVLLDLREGEPARAGLRSGPAGVEVVMRGRCRGRDRDSTLSRSAGAGVDRLEPLDLGDGREAVAFGLRSGAAARLVEAAVVDVPGGACGEPRRLFSYPEDAGHDGALLADASFETIPAAGGDPAELVVREGLVRRGEPLCCPTRMRTLRLQLEDERFEIVEEEEGPAPAAGLPGP